MKRTACIALLAAFAGPALAAEDPVATADREWRAGIEQLAPIGARMAAKLRDPADPQLRAELFRFLYSQLAASYIGLLYASPAHPDFWPMFNETFNEGFPNPDDAYYATVIDDVGSYRISGTRGTVHMLDIQVGSGPLNARGTGGFGPTLANYNVDELHIGKDGRFEVLLSPTRPADWKGDWWKLAPTATYLLVRQRAWDILTEVDARLAIERLDSPAIRPRATPEQIAAAIEGIPKWVEGWTTFSIDWVKRLRAQGLVNRVQVKDYSHTSGLSTQKYIEGVFQLAPDEALIVETAVPAHCRYWDFQLTDELWSSVGWMHRQSSLNGHTARLDKDGKFRAVVSAQDPGVPNWLDNGGLQEGLLYGRWTACDSEPTPTVTRVKVADVRAHLPQDTPVVTPAERDASIRRHREGVQMRRRW